MKRLLMALGAAILLPAVSLADVAQLREDATQAAAAGNYAEAISKLEAVIELAPEDGTSHYRLATLLMDNADRPQDAMGHFERAGALGFQPLGVAYRLSRIHARSGRAEQALTQLEVMATGGFGLPNLIEGEADYDTIRTDPRFIAALKTIRSARYPCESDERHHAFDFWIGDWRVTQGGQFAGTNTISAIMGHCLIFEQWTSASGSEGRSFNYYDPGRDHWRQIWVSDSGSFIEFTGQVRDGGIFYMAETINPADGAATQHKFEFTTNDDGSVRQFWQTSADAGTTWSTIWDAQYDRAE